MYMVLTNTTPHDSNLSAHTALPHQVTGSLRNFPRQHLIPVFRDPHDMVLDIVDGVASGPILQLLSPCRHITNRRQPVNALKLFA